MTFLKCSHASDLVTVGHKNVRISRGQQLESLLLHLLRSSLMGPWQSSKRLDPCYPLWRLMIFLISGCWLVAGLALAISAENQEMENCFLCLSFFL